MDVRTVAKTSIGLVALACALWFGYFVWPTPWEYRSGWDNAVLRVRRSSGDTQLLDPDSGWVRLPFHGQGDPFRKIGDVRAPTDTASRDPFDVMAQHLRADTASHAVGAFIPRRP